MPPNTGPNTRLGRYHLTEFIGEGPTGVVHKARIDGTGRVFALKEFRKNYTADPMIAAAIATAARQYGALEHPRVASLHGFAATDEYILAATECIDGISLDLILLDSAESGKRLPLGCSAKLLVQLGRGIGYAHGRGLCHLGISPSNILCNRLGELSVTDFGFLAPGLIGKRNFDPPLETRWAYVSPEQLEDKPTSPASDVYSMGTIAYELLVGHLPYGDASGDELSNAILQGNIPGLTPNCGPELDLPKPFRKVLKRALARSRFERFPDAAAMADGLEAAMRAVPVPGGLREVGNIVATRLELGVNGEETRVYDDTAEAIANEFNDIKTEDLSRFAPTDLRAETTKVDDGTVANAIDTSSGVPELLLGPAGTGPTGTGQQFIGGENYGHPDEEEETRVERPIGHTPVASDVLASNVEEETNVHSKESQDSSSLVVGLADIEDDVSDILELPLNAPLSIEVPHLPMSASPLAVSPLAGDPREIPPPQRLDTLENSLPTKRTTRETNRADITKKPTVKPKSNVGMYGAALVAILIVAVLGYTFLIAKDGDINGDTKSDNSVANSVSQDAMGATPTSGSTLHSNSGPTKDASNKDAIRQMGVMEKNDAAIALSDATAKPSLDAAIVLSDAATGLSDATAKPNVDDQIPVGTTSQLIIQSTPSGAKIYLDGTLAGETPMNIDASQDRHRLALLLPGYNLHTADIAGHGLITVSLSEVTPSEGPAGIKVRCRKKDRYYIFVDDNPTGQLCPSERIGVPKGKHVVEIYDPVTDSRREFKATVTGTRASLRIRVD